MWSRAAASDSGVGPNRNRYIVSQVLDNTALRPREPRLSEEEVTFERDRLGFVQHGAAAGTAPEDQEVVTGEFQLMNGEDRETSDETGMYWSSLLAERHLSRRLFGSMKQRE
jgi:hypothetical protein